MTRLPRPVAALLLIGLTLASPGFAQSNSQKLDQAVRAALKRNPNASQRVILTARPGYLAALKQALKSRGAAIISENASLNVLTAQVSGGDIKRFADDVRVANISTDSLVQTNATTSAGQLGATGSVMRATLGLSSTAYTGNGIGVAVIDSGVKSVADFQGRLAGSYDFLNGTGAIATAVTITAMARTWPV